MAKLVEILARELEEWPDDTPCITQDPDGYSLGMFQDELGDLRFDERLGEWIGICAGFMEIMELSEDHRTAIVTRAEWQAAVDALKAKDIASSTAAMIDAGWIDPKTPVSPSLHAQVVGRANRIPEWDGVGLPPVGTVCQFKDGMSDGSDWHNKLEPGMTVKIVAHFENNGVQIAAFTFECERGCMQVEQAVAGCFVPIRTTEQIAAEEREKGISDIAEDLGKRTWGVTIQEWLYDLGYRKQEPK